MSRSRSRCSRRRCAGWPASALRLVERDVLRALPEHEPAELAQLLAALDDRREVVAREGASLARKARSAVREEDLGLAHAARVEEQLTRRRVARSALGTDAHV